MSKNIIVAEDSSVLQNLIKKILLELDCKTVAVKNGVDLIKKLEQESFDLVLLDINIPKKNGIDCIKEIRATHSKEELPVLAVTGNAYNYSEEEFKEFGFNDLILKPIDFDSLVADVSKWLR